MRELQSLKTLHNNHYLQSNSVFILYNPEFPILEVECRLKNKYQFKLSSLSFVTWIIVRSQNIIQYVYNNRYNFYNLNGNIKSVKTYSTRLHIRFRTRPIPYERLSKLSAQCGYVNNIVLPDGQVRARAYVSIEHAAVEHAPRPSAATAVYYI